MDICAARALIQDGGNDEAGLDWQAELEALKDRFGDNEHELVDEDKLGRGSPADESRNELPHAGNSVPNIVPSGDDEHELADEDEDELGRGSPADESRDELPHAGNSVPNIVPSSPADDGHDEPEHPPDPENDAALESIQNIPPCSPTNEDGVRPEQQQHSEAQLGFSFPAVNTVPTSTPTILSLLNVNDEPPEPVVPTPVSSILGNLSMIDHMIDPRLRDDIIASSSPIVGLGAPSNIQTMSGKDKRGKKSHQSYVQKEKTIPADSGGCGQRTRKAVSKDVVPLTDSSRAYPSWLKNVMEAAMDLHLGMAWQLCVDAWLTFEKSFLLEEVTLVSVFFVFKTILTSFISVPLTKQQISAPNCD